MTKPEATSIGQKARTPPLWALAALLALATLAVYLPVIGHNFVNFDDDKFIYDNELIRSLSAESLGDFFTAQLFTPHYKPIVYLSWAVEYRLFGLDPAAFHLDNLLLHVANSILVLLLAARLLRAANWDEAVSGWAPFFAALLFALHPLKVESVAWATERKDVLFAFFFLASLLAYVRYRESSRRGALVASTLLFGVGLLAKSMIVTLPAVLFLVDSLYRWQGRRRLVVEKLGFFVLLAGGLWLYGLGSDLGLGGPSGAAQGGRIVKTAPVETPGVALVETPAEAPVETPVEASTEAWSESPVETRTPASGPLGEIRRATAAGHPFVSASYRYAVYAARLAAPARLAVLYRVPDHVRRGDHLGLYVAGWVALAALALLAWHTSRLPFIALLFYSITLVPGLLASESGTNFLADRYTYAASLGFCLLLAWLAWWSVSLRPALRIPVVVAALVYVGFLTFTTRNQLVTWKSSLTLWNRVIETSGELPVALNNRGLARREAGDAAAALADFDRAVEIDPNYFAAYNNRSAARQTMGDLEGALSDATLALRLRPASATTHKNRGIILAGLGRPLEAIIDYDIALELMASSGSGASARLRGDAFLLRSLARERVGDYAGSADDASRALEAGADPVPALLQRAIARMALGDLSGSVADSGEALRLDPTSAAAWNNRGYARFALGDPEGAIADYDRAIRLQPDYPLAYRNRGDAKTASGRIADGCRDWEYAAQQGGAEIDVRLAEFCR